MEQHHGDAHMSASAHPQSFLAYELGSREVYDDMHTICDLGQCWFNQLCRCYEDILLQVTDPKNSEGSVPGGPHVDGLSYYQSIIFPDARSFSPLISSSPPHHLPYPPN
jgi:hypothetical protein